MNFENVLQKTFLLSEFRGNEVLIALFPEPKMAAYTEFDENELPEYQLSCALVYIFNREIYRGTFEYKFNGVRVV